MLSQPRVCTDTNDKALGKQCIVCRNLIQLGETIQIYYSNGRCKHADCIAKTKKNNSIAKNLDQKTKEEIEREIRDAGRHVDVLPSNGRRVMKKGNYLS